MHPAEPGADPSLPAELVQLSIVARGCSGASIEATPLVQLCMLAVETAGFRALKGVVHAFTPHGVSAAVLLAQSHLVVSTWPEFGTVTIDLAVCGTRASAVELWQVLREALNPKSVQITERTLSLRA